MLSKYLSSSFRSPLRHLAVAEAAGTLSAPFLRFALLKLSLLSTSAAGNDTTRGSAEANNTCTMSEFLLNKCGMCQSEISVALKCMPSLVERRDTHTPQKALQFMRDSGLTEHQVRKLITKNPFIICLKADRQLKPKIELMKTSGLSAQEIGKVICLYPRLLSCSLEKTLRPNIQYLQNLLGPEADVSKVFKWAPQILTFSNGPEILGERFKHLASFGLMEDEIKQLVSRRPLILNVSMDKVQKIMDYFIHTTGLGVKFLLKYPVVLSYSLECRIKPRHNVLKSISSMQPSKRLSSLTYMLSLSEREFLEKYVRFSPHATKLLEIYKGQAC